MVKKIIKTAVDAAMFMLFLLLMEYHLLPDLVHEWLGTGEPCGTKAIWAGTRLF